MTVKTIAVVSAGLSQPSSTRLLADQLAAAVGSELKLLGTPVETHTVDLREHAHDLVNTMLTGFATGTLRAAIDTVVGADGLIAVTPVFSASYSGLFKSFFDVLERDSLVDKPVLIAATGGTARHSLALEYAMRPLFTYLRGVVVPTSVFAAPEDWAGTSAHGTLRGRIDRAAVEFAALVHQREKSVAPDPFALTTTFEQMLGEEHR